METKLNLTVYDVVTFLIPGSILILSFRYLEGIGSELSDVQFVVFVLIVGYLLGAVLHLIGILLFTGFYKEDHKTGTIGWRIVSILDLVISKVPTLHMHSSTGNYKAKLIKMIQKSFGLDFKNNRLGLFTFADTFVSNLPFNERDVLMAKEGFFRTLTALVLVESIYLGLRNEAHRIAIFSAGLVLLELVRYGREYYRTLKNQQIYLLALMKMKKGQDD